MNLNNARTYNWQLQSLFEKVLCICMHLRHALSVFLPLSRGWRATEPPSSGRSNTSKYKEPHSEAPTAILHTHTAKRTPRAIQHTAWSHYGKQCVGLLAVKHSQENVKPKKWQSLEDGTKTWRSPQSVQELSPPLLPSHLNWSEFIKHAQERFPQLTTIFHSLSYPSSLGVHMCKVILVPEERPWCLWTLAGRNLHIKVCLQVLGCTTTYVFFLKKELSHPQMELWEV